MNIISLYILYLCIFIYIYVYIYQTNTDIDPKIIYPFASLGNIFTKIYFWLFGLQRLEPRGHHLLRNGFRRQIC